MDIILLSKLMRVSGGQTVFPQIFFSCWDHDLRRGQSEKDIVLLIKTMTCPEG